MKCIIVKVPLNGDIDIIYNGLEQEISNLIDFYFIVNLDSNLKLFKLDSGDGAYTLLAINVLDVSLNFTESINIAVHEVKNSLAIFTSSIFLALKYLKKDPLPLEKIASLLEETQDSVEQVIRICDKLKEDSTTVKRESNSSTLVKEYFEKLPGKLKASLGIHNIDVNIKLDECFSESDQFEIVGLFFDQIIINLTKNSIDALEGISGKKVTIEAKKENNGKEIYISFMDNGVGISSENYKKIFVQNFTTKGDKGSGIGLFLIKKHIELSKGTVEIDKSFKEGFKLDLRLPLNEKE